ncbi:MAG: histidine kinase [Bacteroidota bacterium]
MSKLEKYLPFILAAVTPLMTIFNYSSFVEEIQFDLVLLTYTQTGITILIIWYSNKWLIGLKWKSVSSWFILFVGNLIIISIISYLSVLNAPKELSAIISFWVLFIRLALVAVILNVVLRVFESQKERSKLQVQNLALQSENLKFQVETLKQQINPHFLFNSLNTLLDLIEDNQEEAVDFTRKFSSLYRIVLQSSDHDFIPLKDELQFLNDYWILLKTRFRDAIALEVHLSKEKEDLQIPPLSLQFLVENAVKHNEASKIKPLKIIIRESDNCLIVSNKIIPKSFSVPGEKVGLENLQKRFTLLFQPIEFGKNDGDFVVKLPLKS